MVALPFVWFVSVLTIIATYALVTDTRIPAHARLFLAIFLMCLGAIALLLGFRLSFQYEWASRLQPYVAILAAPSAFLGFSAFAQDEGANWRQSVYWNGLVFGIALLGLMAPIPVSEDFFVLAINGIYFFKISRLLRHGIDHFDLVPSHAIHILRAAIFATSALIGMMIAVDAFIVMIGFVAAESHLLGLLTGASGVLAAFIFVVCLVGAPMLLKSSKNMDNSSQPATDADIALMNKIDTLMEQTQLYRDSNLTLARFAKRLSVPARDVSGATNRVKSMNFSRYVNSLRISYAKRALRESDLPITEIMFEAGYISKSNFNTEFRRVTGKTPTQYKREAV